MMNSQIRVEKNYWYS